MMNFTSVDRNTAVRYLKSSGWDSEAACNAYFAGGGGGSATSMGGRSALNKLFDGLRDDVANAPDAIGPDGTMTYFEKLGIDLEGLEVLVVQEIVQAPSMGEMTRSGFVDGWSVVNCETIEKQKAYIKSLHHTLPSNKEVFTKVYKYTFLLGKASNQKAVLLDNAITYWELLFSSPLSAVKWSSSDSPWLTWWTEFLRDRWKKSVNRDMWNETLKFAQLTLEDEALSFWSEESSWPSVIDDFVEYVKKEKRGGGETEDAMEE